MTEKHSFKNDEETKRRNQNAMNLLMVTVLLYTVIFIHDRCTAYFTQREAIPGLGVAGKWPQLEQLGLDARNPPRSSVLPDDYMLRTATNKLADLNKQSKPASPDQKALSTSAEQTKAENAVNDAKAAIALEYANRLSYMSFTALYMVICLMAVPVGFYIMCSALRSYPPAEDTIWGTFRRHPVIQWMTAFALLIAGYVISCFYRNPAPEDVSQILHHTILHDIDGNPNNLYNAFNAFGMGVTVYLAVIAICVMWHPQYQPYQSLTEEEQRKYRPKDTSGLTFKQINAQQESNYRVETDARYLGVQLKQLRLVLYISTAVLIMRIVQSSAGMNWALAFIIPQNGTVYDSVKTLVNSFVMVQGVYHTTLLAVIYLPPAVVLSQRISQLADSQGKYLTKERKDWLDDRGLSFNAMAQVPNMLAILAPLLAGPAKDLISHIAGH